MSSSILNARLVMLSDTTANWEAAAAGVLLKGEIGIEFTVDGKAKMKIGDGVTPWGELAYFGGVTEELLPLGDGKSIVVEDGQIKLFGFGTAQPGQVPQMGADGSLVWYTPVTAETVAAVSAKIDTLNSTVEGQAAAIAALEEASADLKTRVTALEEKASKAYKYVGSVATYAELPTEGMAVGDVYNVEQADEAHGISAGDNVAWNGTGWDNLHGLIDLSNLATKVELAETNMQVAANKSLLDYVNASTRKNKFEVSGTPAGTIVDYRDKEIRIMCPADAAFVKQSVGVGGDANTYYITFNTYAPNGAIGYKESLGSNRDLEILTDLKTDIYGRKYQPTWLGIAKYDESTGQWAYYGANSSTEKYVGWDYKIEWYDAAGVMIAADTTRINLSNEACHDYLGDYVGVPVIKELALGETLLDIVNSRVTVPVGAGLKASDEITIAEDGSLGVGTISINKVTQEENTVLILNGGGASSILG